MIHARWLGRTLAYIGLSIGVVGGSTTVVLSLLALYAKFKPPRPAATIVTWHIAIIVLVSLLGPVIFRLGRRLAQEPAEARVAGDRRARALLLRPFLADGLVAEPHWRQRWTYVILGRSSFEERLASVMDNVGPPVAIGRPGEVVPTYGFARTYVPDDKWQNTVHVNVMAAGWAVFVLTHATDSLLWEIQLVQRSGVKALYVLPPREARTAQWACEYERIAANLPMLRPATPELAALLCVPGEPPLRIEMGGPWSARWQLRAVREALVPRFL